MRRRRGAAYAAGRGRAAAAVSPPWPDAPRDQLARLRGHGRRDAHDGPRRTPHDRRERPRAASSTLGGASRPAPSSQSGPRLASALVDHLVPAQHLRFADRQPLADRPPRAKGCDGDRGDVVLADARPCDAGPRRGAPVRRSTPSDTIAWASASDRLGLADPSRDRAMSIGAEARSLPASRAVRTIAWAPEPRPACPRSRTLPRIWGITHHVHTPSAGGRSAWSRESDGPSRAGSGVAERQASELPASPEPSVRWLRRAAVVNRRAAGLQGVNIMCDSARTERWRLDASAGRSEHARICGVACDPCRPCNKRLMRVGAGPGSAPAGRCAPGSE